MPREINQPGVPSPGVDYVSSVGVAPEERADMSIADVAAEKVAVATDGGAKEVATQIASALAELVGVANGGGKRQIPPHVIKERRDALADMHVLLAHYRDTGEMPLYELTAPLFADDILIPATRQDGRYTVATRIHFVDAPNEQMVPRNEPAQQIMALYLKGIGGKTPDLADQSYEAYLNRPRIAAVVGAPIETPMMGTPHALHEARATVLENTPAEEQRYVGPRKQMGTVQPEVHGTI